MAYTDDLPEFTFESATQDEKQLNAAITELGYEVADSSSETDHDEPEPEAVPAVEPAPAAEPEAEADPEPETDPKPAPAAKPAEPGKSRAAKTRAELREQKEVNVRLQLKLEELEKRIDSRPGTVAASEAPKSAAVAPPTPEAKFDRAKPVYDDTKHASYEDYLEELTDFKVDEKEFKRGETQRQAKEAEQRAAQEKTTREAKSREQAEQAQLRKRWDDNAAVAEIRFPDWKAVMMAPRESKPHNAVAAAVAMRDDINNAELAYFLVKNPATEKALNEIAAVLGPDPDNAPPAKIREVMRKLDRALDAHVQALADYEPEAEADEPAEATPAPKPPARTEPAPGGPTAAKRSPQQPPPQAQPAPAPAAKPKPAIPTPVGGRGSTHSLSEWDKAQRGEQVNPDKLREEWEKKQGGARLA